MILQFKTQIKQLRDEVCIKDEELTKLKKSIKYTKIAELEKESKAYGDETVRLKNYIS